MTRRTLLELIGILSLAFGVILIARALCHGWLYAGIVLVVLLTLLWLLANSGGQGGDDGNLPYVT